MTELSLERVARRLERLYRETLAVAEGRALTGD
jgi:hypothetical protein